MKKSLIIVLTIAICLNFIPVTANAMDINSSEEFGYDVTKLGADGSDKIDDTRAIQNALDKYDSVYVPAGTYMINVEKSLELRTNQKLIMDKLAVLEALPTSRGNSSVINISNASNVFISGGEIVGERYSHNGTSGEWGMGILVENGSNNIIIKDMIIRDCWGDGIYLGGTSLVKKITIDNVISTNNRRQGLSITNASEVTVSNSIFKDTNGTAPEAGIDIEPNKGQTTEKIKIINTQCYNNGGSGIDLMGLSEKILGVEVIGSTFSDNSSYGIRIDNAKDVSFSNSKSTNNYIGIEVPRDAANVKFSNMTISDNMARGVALIATAQAEGIDNVLFENSIISNNSKIEAGGLDGVRIDNYDLTGYVRNIKFTGCVFTDTQSAKTQRYGITVGFSDKISDIVIEENNFFQGNVVGDLLADRAVVTIK